jgi:predicted ATPase
MMHRFGGHGFYVLDEPEAALSPTRQLAMISRIHQLVRTRSQFVIATHSPILMAYPNAWIYQIGAGGLERVPLEDTEHYVVAKRFLNDTRGQLARLLD